MTRGIIIAHGGIGNAFVEAVESIVGNCKELYTISVTNMSVVEIRDRLLSLINAPDAEKDGVVLMACLKGGSSWNVSASLAMEKEYVRVISGVNLSVVLAFMTKRDSMNLDELMEVMQQRGQRDIVTMQRERQL